MTYKFDTNTLVTTSWECAFRLKQLLVSAGWVVKSSGDGLAAFSSSGDVITQKSTGVGGMANQNAWFRIQDPGGVREFSFLARPTQGIGQWVIKYSAQAKFTGGSPNATTPATATDQVFIVGSAETTPALWTQSTDGTYRWNGMADNAAPYGFWSLAFPSGTPNSVSVHTVLILDPLVSGSYPASDLDPAVIMSTPGGPATLSISTQSTQMRCWYNYGGTGATFQSVQGTNIVISNVTSIPGSGGGQFSNRNKKFAYPIHWGRNVFTNSNTTPSGWKGRSTYIKMPSMRFDFATAVGINTARDTIAFDDLLLPWDGSFPLL